MTVAAYIRVSSRGQDHALQRDAIERKGVQVGAWYAEKLSARTTNRPELKRLLTDARAGLFSELWVFKLDRLTRSGVADTFAVVSELRKAGVTLHCVADGVTIKPSEDVASDVMVFALGLSAGLERVAINDRIAAAREHMAARGEPWGRPPRMTPAEVVTARRMAGEGRTVREISAALGVPRSTAARALRTPQGVVSQHPGLGTCA
jgi:DNA invertase Pin-like site-specific DNA recombinase